MHIAVLWSRKTLNTNGALLWLLKWLKMAPLNGGFTGDHTGRPDGENSVLDCFRAFKKAQERVA